MKKRKSPVIILLLILSAALFLSSVLLLGGGCIGSLLFLGDGGGLTRPDGTESGLIVGNDTPEPDPSAPLLIPEELSALLTDGKVSSEALFESGCRQLIIVSTEGSDAEIRFFRAAEGVWEEDQTLSAKGFVGILGASPEMAEGKQMTPVGLYTVDLAFYTEKAPETGLDSFKITENTYWVDDPESAYYNTRVEGTENKDWSSAEHMIDYSGYRYGFTIGYNPECVAGKGSAIFFHISNGPTAGCVGTNESTVLALLKVLDRESCPHILII